MREDNIRFSRIIPAVLYKEYREHEEKRLYTEASDVLMERLKNGEKLALIPHNIRESVIRRGYGDEVVLNLEIEVYTIRDATVYDTMRDKMRSLLEKDAYVRVPYNYLWSHSHPNSPPSIIDIKGLSKEMHFTRWDVILEPVYNDSGKELGRMGKCEGCGKVFYCLREEL